MRKLIISILLASAAAGPALAEPNDNLDRAAARAERQQAREDSRSERQQARSERSDNSARFAPQPDRNVEPRQQTFVAPVRSSPDDRVNVRAMETMRAQRDANTFRAQRDANDFRAQRDANTFRAQRDADAFRAQRDARIEQRQQRNQQVRDNRGFDPNRPTPNFVRRPTPVVSDVPRFGTQPPLRTEPRNAVSTQWRSDWRHDNRYDWANWRNHHRSRFHLGFYFDPFGWGYQPYSIGWRLWPSYYSSNYWINDPWEYRLPYAPPGTRWIRYYDDALLVDTWTGEVVDVIPSFFW